MRSMELGGISVVGVLDSVVEEIGSVKEADVVAVTGVFVDFSSSRKPLRLSDNVNSCSLTLY